MVHDHKPWVYFHIACSFSAQRRCGTLSSSQRLPLLWEQKRSKKTPFRVQSDTTTWCVTLVNAINRRVTYLLGLVGYVQGATERSLTHHGLKRRLQKCLDMFGSNILTLITSIMFNMCGCFCGVQHLVSISRIHNFIKHIAWGISDNITVILSCKNYWQTANIL